MKLPFKIFFTIFLLIVDYVLISSYLENKRFHTSSSLGAIIVLIPSVFIINIIIAIIFLLLKKYSFVSIFVVNALLATIIAFLLF